MDAGMTTELTALQSMLTTSSSDDFHPHYSDVISASPRHHRHRHRHHDDPSPDRHNDYAVGLSVSPTPLGSDGSYIDDYTGVLNKDLNSHNLHSLVATTTTTPGKNGPMVLINKQYTNVRNIWKEVPNESPYHPPRSNIIIVVKKENSAENVEEIEETVEEEEVPFDYSIFLNKPSSPSKPDTEPEIVKPEEVPIEENEVVVENEAVTDDNVEEILENNPVYFGNYGGEKKEEISLRDENGKELFQCNLCSLTFTRKCNHARHKLTHYVKSTSKPYRYRCEVCERDFLQRCDLLRHMHIHDDTYPYRCDVCNKGYIRRKDLEIHMRFHTRERSFKCDLCSKSYFSKSDRSRHVRLVHTKPPKLDCGHCGRKFIKEATLLQHMQQKHNEVILSAFKEQVCKLQQKPYVVEVDTVTNSRLKVTSSHEATSSHHGDVALSSSDSANVSDCSMDTDSMGNPCYSSTTSDSSCSLTSTSVT